MYNDSETMVMMVEILIAENKLIQAKKWLDNILAIYPNNPNALYNLGVYYIVIKNNGKRLLRHMKNPLFFMRMIQRR